MFTKADSCFFVVVLWSLFCFEFFEQKKYLQSKHSSGMSVPKLLSQCDLKIAIVTTVLKVG